MAKGYVQTKFEATPGTENDSPTLSTKTTYTPVQSATPALNPTPLDRNDEVRNLDQPVTVLPEAYDPSFELQSRAYPDIVGVELKAQLGAPTTTAGDDIIEDPDGNTVATGAYKHTWVAPFGPTGLSPQTSQRIFGYSDQGVFLKAKGCATSSLGIESPESGGATLSVQGMAAWLDTISDPSLTPSYESLSIGPFTRGGLTVTWLSGSAKTSDFSLNIESPIEMARTLGAASKYPDSVEKGDGLIAVTGSIPKRSFDAEDYAALRDSTSFESLVKWENDAEVVSGQKYLLFVEMPTCQLTGGGPDALTNARRIGASYDFAAKYDGTAAAATITLINATASYA